MRRGCIVPRKGPRAAYAGANGRAVASAPGYSILPVVNLVAKNSPYRRPLWPAPTICAASSRADAGQHLLGRLQAPPLRRGTSPRLRRRTATTRPGSICPWQSRPQPLHRHTEVIDTGTHGKQEPKLFDMDGSGCSRAIDRHEKQPMPSPGNRPCIFGLLEPERGIGLRYLHTSPYQLGYKAMPCRAVRVSRSFVTGAFKAQLALTFGRLNKPSVLPMVSLSVPAFGANHRLDLRAVGCEHSITSDGVCTEGRGKHSLSVTGRHAGGYPHAVYERANAPGLPSGAGTSGDVPGPILSKNPRQINQRGPHGPGERCWPKNSRGVGCKESQPAEVPAHCSTEGRGKCCQPLPVVGGAFNNPPLFTSVSVLPACPPNSFIAIISKSTRQPPDHRPPQQDATVTVPGPKHQYSNALSTLAHAD